MRAQDAKKREAVCLSAIRLINRLGFDGVSIAKIAKEADVSPATIYIYFANKEDMLNQLYLEAKRQMSQFILRDIDLQGEPEKVFRELLYRHWFFCSQHAETFAFLEQFSSSPQITRLSSEEGCTYYQPVRDLFTQAQAAGVLKPLAPQILHTLAVMPMIQLAKQNQSLSPRELEEVISLLWESIKS